MRWNRFSLWIAVLIASGGLAPTWAGVEYQTIALTGGEAPGAAGGVKFGHFGSSTINSDGRIAFVADLVGPSIDSSDSHGIWSGAPSSISLVARQGTAAPGGGLYDTLNDPVLSDTGTISFAGQSNLQKTIWVGAPGSLAVAAHEGQLISGSGSTARYLNLVGDPVLSDQGEVAFSAWQSNADRSITSNQGAYFATPGSLTLLASRGGSVPGTGYSYTTVYTPLINSSGNVAFLAENTGPSGADIGILGGSPNSPAFIVRAGDPAPGVGAGGKLVSFQPTTNGGTPSFNSAGQVAFAGSASSNSGSADGIWLASAGIVQSISRSNASPIPGLTVTNFRPDLALNNQGQVAFVDTVHEPAASRDGAGLWLGDVNTLSLIAREGDAAPGTPGLFFNGDFSPILNDIGQIAFTDNLIAPGSSTPTSLGLWLTDAGGVLQLVARTGAAFDVDSGPGDDLRTVSDILPVAGTNPAAGQRRALSDTGQLAFRLIFSDGTEGIFLATAVPEPASATLMLAPLSHALFRPRGRRGRRKHT